MNEHTLLTEFRKKQVYSEGYPTMLTIEPTNYCNLKCVMCPREFQSHGRGFMSMDLFKKIIEESMGKTKFIWLHYMGEPLIHPKLFDMIELASDSGIKVGLSTNGTILNSTNRLKLLKSRLHLLIISIDAVTSSTYGLVRGKANLYDKVVSNTEKLLVDSAGKMFVAIQLVLQSGNRKEMQSFLDYWGKYGNQRIKIVIKSLTDWNQFDYTEIGKDNHPFPPRSCMEPWRTLTIHWNGRISPCCNDFNNQVPLGDVSVNTIREIWNGKAIIELRKSFKTRALAEICKRCGGITDTSLFYNEFAEFKGPAS